MDKKRTLMPLRDCISAIGNKSFYADDKMPNGAKDPLHLAPRSCDVDAALWTIHGILWEILRLVDAKQETDKDDQEKA